MGPVPTGAAVWDHEGVHLDGVSGVGLRARLLGRFGVEGCDLSTLRSRKARTLLKVLVLAEGRPVGIDRLVDCLWGDQPPARPGREVAVNASRARAVVGAEAVERTDGGYRARLAWSDLLALSELEREAARRHDAGDHVAARTTATAGLALVRGELLGDEVDPWWAEAEIEATARRIASLRRISARSALALGALSAAASEAEQALALDPFDEAALRVLMSAQVASGRPASALAAYAAARVRLAEELGVDPSVETEELHDAILLDRPLPGAPSPVASPVADRGREGEEVAGRSVELAALDAALRALDERPEVIALEGEAGSGKTTVLDAFARRASATGAAVLRAACDERGIDLPLEPVADALARALDTLDAEERARVLGSDAELLGPLLGPGTTAGPAATLPGPTATTDALRAALFGSLGRVLGRLAPGRPLVLLLDDAHGADEATTAWLRHLVRRGEPVVLVVAARRTNGGGPAAVGGVEPTAVVPLLPLDLDAARSIVGDDRAPALLERSGGNALFLVELAAADPGDDLPESVRAAVTGRIRDPAAAATVHSAAVLGTDVDLDLLGAALQRSPLALLDHLEVALAAGLLHERDGVLAFRHALVRDALAAEVTGPRQVLLHREAARTLAARSRVDPLLVAHHARAAGDPEAAAAALAVGAEAAAHRFDLAEAERLVTEALSLAPSGDLLVRRGRIRLARADLDGAEADAVAAVADCGAPALELRAWVARLRHDMETALRVGTEAAARADDPTTLISARLAVAFAHRGLGDLVSAERELVAAIGTEGSDRLGAKGWLGVLRVHQGRPQEALDLLEPAVGAEVDSVHGFWVEHTLQMAVHAYGMTGRIVEARALLDRLDRELDRRGSRDRYRGLVASYRGWIGRNLDDPAGLDDAAEAVEVATMAEPRTQATLDLADGHLRRGDDDRAARLLDEAEEEMRVRWFQNRWRSEARLGLLRSHLWLARHEPEAAGLCAATRRHRRCGAR